jgi:LuxR family transcriptional regulator, maltose regulon positive regulatory protein
MATKAELREQRRQPPLVLTKLHPPPRREQTVLRDRLVDRLQPHPGIKLTVVAAPAGYGKTTLLGTWRETEEANRPVAWLSLDEGDNDPVVLWSYVVAALRGVCPALDLSSSPDVLGPTRIMDTLLPELLNELTAIGDAALVLDDFHRLTSGPARDSVAWFVDRVPASFQLVLATRSEPALPLGALRGHGELLEVRAGDLGFTPAEAHTLLNERLELDLEEDDVDGLVERTEGWPAGVYLAGLSLQGVEDRHAFLARFGGESRHAVDFLVDEVLDAHDPATQALMLRSSVLEQLCGPLCDALLEQEGSGRLLQALARTNLFLLPLDERGEWYRFHHLFAQLLRVELEHREPGLIPTLHRRAFAWHQANGSVEAAIEHALQADAPAEAGELIAAAWIHYVNAGRHATVLGWLERLPRSMIRVDPNLLLVQAWVLSVCARREDAAAAMAAAEQLGRLERGPLPDGFSSLEASLATLRGAVPGGDTGSGLENALRAAELEGPQSPWRPVVCFAVGSNLYFTGAFDEADRWLTESTELAPPREQWLVAVTALAVRSLLEGERRRLDQQAVLAEHAVQLAREHGLEEVAGEVFVALGASLAARGQLTEGLAQLERGIAMLRIGGHPLPLPLATALLHRAAVIRTMGREDAAAAIEEARTAVDACPDVPLLERRLSEFEQPTRPPRANGERTLSARELTILRMLTGRLSERDIGRELYLSHNTIHSHTRSIYRKLGASSRSEALEQARALGLI